MVTAKDIESARLEYVASLGTGREPLYRYNLELLIERARREHDGREKRARLIAEAQKLEQELS